MSIPVDTPARSSATTRSSVATLPAFRRLGYAEAIMRQVIEEAAAAGTVLQSTRSGLSLYERMGYRMVTNFNVYIAD